MHAVDAHGIGLILHPTRDPGPAAETIVAWARARATDVLVRHEDAHRCPAGVQAVGEEELATRAQALLSIGGDGTMLGALRLVVGRDVPVLGVNLGKLGFLIEVEPDELDGALDRLERGDFTIEPHSALLVEGPDLEMAGFNEMAITRIPGEGIVHAQLRVGGQRIGRMRGDGVVIATPMGSTAYSYASGGPVVSPGLDAVVVTPTASMFGISRPLVVSTAEPIHLSLLPDSGAAALEIDGALVERIGPSAVVGVRLQPGAGLIVRFDHERHQQRTRVKLSLLDLPYLPDELHELSAGQDALPER
jgi:NAD+ kinase